jgi:N-acetylneuraminic acid mutarotase
MASDRAGLRSMFLPRLLLALMCIAVPLQVGIQAQPPPCVPPLLGVDAPSPDATLRGSLVVSGWALDPTSSSGSGIQDVRVTLDAELGGGTEMGAAQLALVRPDIDAAYGRSGSNAGWRLRVDALAAAEGGHTLKITARSRCGETSLTRPVNAAPETGWALLNPPPGRSAGGVAWDPARGQMYVLGGRGGATHADLWIYSAARNVWTPARPTGAALPRLSAHSAVWDPIDDQLLIFGGFGGEQTDGLWAYHPADNRLEQLMPDGPAPAGRGYHSAVWTGDAMLVFGGVGGRFDLFEDLWSYDPRANAWTPIPTPEPRPSGRFYQSAAWDPVSERLLVFGGFDVAIGLLEDFWSYDPADNSWTQLLPNDRWPPSRLSASMVWDPRNQQLMLYGGGCGGCYRDDLWSYQPARDTWELRAMSADRPRARGGSGAVWDEARQQMLIFAGGESLNDLWSYRPDTNIWSRLTPLVTVLPALASAQSVWDPVRSQMLLFGGDTGTADHGPVDVVRIYRPATHGWEEIPTNGGPRVRSGHTVVWDDETGQVLVYGGRRDDNTVSDEVWSYQPVGNRWTRLADGTAGPVGRAFHSAAWDPRGRQLWIYGGLGANGSAVEDLWSFRPATGAWQRFAGGPGPRARARHTAVWDPVAGEMLVYGGYRDQEGYTSEVWAFRPEEARWVVREATGAAPVGRSRHTAAWDSASQRMLIFGGFVGGVDYLGDLWAYEPARNAWTQVTAPGGPAARGDAMAIWDPTARQLLVYGGGAGDPTNELWSYRPTPAAAAPSAIPGASATPGAPAPATPTPPTATPVTPRPNSPTPTR